jgi:hypothetical protein
MFKKKQKRWMICIGGSEAFMIGSTVQRELKYHEDVNYMLI